MKNQHSKPVANDDYLRLYNEAIDAGDYLKIIEGLAYLVINLEEESSALKSALSDILQPEAAILEREHRVRAMDALDTPNTDSVAEIMKQDKRDGE
ncbi:hypothetical protein J9K13_002754 [Salmonella enterica]|nr:hypothetical protein [Salmonella enterica]HEC8456416.1 hypothetical protein [Salmonella enterica subsp. enterica serovar Poona]